MVVGVVHAIHFLKPPICRPRRPVVHTPRVGRTEFRDWLVVNAKTLQLMTLIAEIRHFESDIARELTLNIEHPLWDIRRPHILDIPEDLRLPETGSRVAGAREPLTL